MQKGLAELVHPEDLEATLERHRLRQDGETLDHAYEFKMARKDGTPITVYGSFALSVHEGKTANVGFIRDITERKKGEKALWRSQRLASVGRLAAEIAHEMNNPLTSVLTFCKLANSILEKEPFPEERLSELRNYITYLNSEYPAFRHRLDCIP